jgi:hypothetical protein
VPIAPEPGAEYCPDCGGSLVSGKVAVPIIGTLRFVYRIGTNEIATEVRAQMCADCGRVVLRATDPGLIRRAQEAGRLGRTSPRWGLPRRDTASRPDTTSSDGNG